MQRNAKVSEFCDTCINGFDKYDVKLLCVLEISRTTERNLSRILDKSDITGNQELVEQTRE